MVLPLHIQALMGLWRGLRGNLAWADRERDPQGIPAELLLAAKKDRRAVRAKPSAEIPKDLRNILTAPYPPGAAPQPPPAKEILT